MFFWQKYFNIVKYSKFYLLYFAVMKKYKEIEIWAPEKELPDLWKRWLKELEKHQMKNLVNVLSDDKNENVYNKKIKYEVKVDELTKYPIVSLSWKVNAASILNWIKNHMEAYPETWNGFWVKFIDDKEFEGYYVKLRETKKNWDVVLDWVEYKVRLYDISDGLNSVNNISRTEDKTKRDLYDSLDIYYRDAS